MARRGAGGFTLVEVIVGGTAASAIGIAAAVAIPAYKDHTVRSQVADLVLAAAKCRVSVARYYATHLRFPASSKEAGCPERVTANENPLGIYEGEILVQAVGPLAKELGSKNMFAYRAVCASGACEGTPIQAWSCASSGQDASSTTIPAKYLPAACR